MDELAESLHQMIGLLTDDVAADPAILALLGQLTQVLEEPSMDIPPELLQSLTSTDKAERFRQAAAALNITDPLELRRLALGLKKGTKNVD